MKHVWMNEGDGWVHHMSFAAEDCDDSSTVSSAAQFEIDDLRDNGIKAKFGPAPVDAAPSDEENETMPAPELTLVPTDVPDADTPEFVAIVADFEATAASKVTAIKGLTGEKNEAKIKAYANIIAGLIANKVRKGTRRAGEIKAALIECGVSKACAKRYLENGQKAKALPWIKAAGSDVDAILAAFAENDVKTEQDLVNIVAPKPVLTAAEELAAKATALTDTDEDAVQALLDAAVLINPGCADVAATLVATLARLDLAA